MSRNNFLGWDVGRFQGPPSLIRFAAQSPGFAEGREGSQEVRKKGATETQRSKARESKKDGETVLCFGLVWVVGCVVWKSFCFFSSEKEGAFYLTVLKKVWISWARRVGCSMAAKWPPWGISVQWVTL